MTKKNISTERRIPKGHTGGGRWTSAGTPSSVAGNRDAKKAVSLARKATAIRIKMYKTKRKIAAASGTEKKALQKRYKQLSDERDAIAEKARKARAKAAESGFDIDAAGRVRATPSSSKPSRDKSRGTTAKKHEQNNGSFDLGLEKAATLHEKALRLSMLSGEVGRLNDASMKKAASDIGITPAEYDKVANVLLKERLKALGEYTNQKAALAKQAKGNAERVHAIQTIDKMKRPSAADAKWQIKHIVKHGYDVDAPQKVTRTIKNLGDKLRKKFSNIDVTGGHKAATGLNDAINAFGLTTGVHASANLRADKNFFRKAEKVRDEFLDAVDKSGGDIDKLLDISEKWQGWAG